MFFNVQYGYQTNSSSSHCILMSNKKFKDKIFERVDFIDIKECLEQDGSWEFGWEYFLLDDVQTKTVYMTKQFYNNSVLDIIGNSDIFKRKIKDDKRFAEAYKLAVKYADSIVIDHQSCYYLNNIRINQKHRDEFLTDFFFTTIYAKECKILGGNDNSYFGDFEIDPKQHMMIDEDVLSSSDIIKRKYGWELRNVDTWYSMTIPILLRIPSFKILEECNYSIQDYIFYAYNNKEEIDPPTLIDLKITDYCTYECTFCYQGSSKSGKHASLTDIFNIVEILGELKVFQIALGGGDPTSHPKLDEILKFTQQHIDYVNITTRNYKTALNYTNKINGGIGLSVLSSKEIDDFFEYYTCYKMLKQSDPLKSSSKLTIHLIPELISTDEAERILNRTKEKYFPMLLLGFKDPKNNNIRTKFSPEDIERLTKVLEIYSNYANVYIDTCFYRKYKDYLKSSKFTCYTHEGLFSKYIDAVEKFVSPSSYETHIKLPFTTKDELTKNLVSNIYTR